ncbi:uncharacterized protein LOC123822482 [Phyllostomus hastatus]|uniref:uncharacterized protein LOC123822482 n=1 Tax=Phyllostomus hastatus TaxID=9423 RepID=UPI001E68070A|nr:uncharacterized protein LOC123822482 [Phyllostomus hastatus]
MSRRPRAELRLALSLTCGITAGFPRQQEPFTADGQRKSAASSRRVSLEPRPSLPRTEDMCRKPRSPENNNHSRLRRHRKAAASGCRLWPKPTEWQRGGLSPPTRSTASRGRRALPSPGLSCLVGKATAFLLHSWFSCKTTAFLQGAVQSFERQTPPTRHTDVSSGVTLSMRTRVQRPVVCSSPLTGERCSDVGRSPVTPRGTVSTTTRKPCGSVFVPVFAAEPEDKSPSKPHARQHLVTVRPFAPEVPTVVSVTFLRRGVRAHGPHSPWTL